MYLLQLELRAGLKTSIKRELNHIYENVRNYPLNSKLPSCTVLELKDSYIEKMFVAELAENLHERQPFIWNACRSPSPLYCTSSFLLLWVA